MNLDGVTRSPIESLNALEEFGVVDPADPIGERLAGSAIDVETTQKRFK